MLRTLFARLTLSKPSVLTTHQTSRTEDRHHWRALHHTVRAVICQDEPCLDDDTALHRRPAWQRQEWAAQLSASLDTTVTATDIANQRTIRGLTHWLYHGTITSEKIDRIRALGW